MDASVRQTRIKHPGVRRAIAEYYPAPIECLKSLVSGQTAQYQPAHRNLYPRRTACRHRLVILAQPPLPTQPPKVPLHHPVPRQHRKSTLPRLARHYLQPVAQPLLDPSRQRAQIPAISPNSRSWENRPASSDRASRVPSQSGTSAGCTTTDSSSSPVSTTINMTLAAHHYLAGIVTARPPFAVVFTDWLSIMAALGSGWRPWRYRACWHKAPLTCCQVRQ